MWRKLWENQENCYDSVRFGENNAVIYIQRTIVPCTKHIKIVANPMFMLILFYSFLYYNNINIILYVYDSIFLYIQKFPDHIIFLLLKFNTILSVFIRHFPISWLFINLFFFALHILLGFFSFAVFLCYVCFYFGKYWEFLIMMTVWHRFFVGFVGTQFCIYWWNIFVF